MTYRSCLLKLKATDYYIWKRLPYCAELVLEALFSVSLALYVEGRVFSLRFVDIQLYHFL